MTELNDKTSDSLADYSDVASDDQAWDAVLPPATLTLIHLEAIVEALPRLVHEITNEPATSLDIVRVWEKDKCLDNVIPKSAFEEVPWSEIQRDKTTYGVMTYSWSDATWADLVPLLKKNARCERMWIECVTNLAQKERTAHRLTPQYPLCNGHASSLDLRATQDSTRSTSRTLTL